MSETASAATSWSDIRAREGRNDLPYLLFTRWNDLTETDRAKALADAWTGPEYPERAADPSMWVTAFDETGYIVDGEILEQDEDKTLPEIVTLYRGSSLEGRSGMSWTLDSSVAAWFATRFDLNLPVWKIEIPKLYVLARFTTRGENECVVDTSEFAPAEYSLWTPEKDS